MTLIIGSEGSMGRRYKAILDHLGEKFECCDLKLGTILINDRFDRFIIATPTETHLQWVKLIDKYNKPILCEKPLSKSLEEAVDIATCQSPLTMQMQYKQLVDPTMSGPSFYNYFHHGSDGIVWDCFQIIALAKGHVDLFEYSPVWRCQINGKYLNRAHMDWAYVEYVRNWIQGQNQTPRDQLVEWHSKVKEFEDKWNSHKSA